MIGIYPFEIEISLYKNMKLTRLVVSKWATFDFFVCDKFCKFLERP